jgi:hypothetical protein
MEENTMKNQLASTYLPQYEGTDVIITDYRYFNLSGFDGDYTNPLTFDLSDGTHWFEDSNDTCQVSDSLTDCEIGWNDNYGWVIINEDGTESQIGWL